MHKHIPLDTFFALISIIAFATETQRAADQEQDRRQACLPTGLSAASAGCEALRAEQPVDEIRSALSKRPRQQVIMRIWISSPL